MFQKLKSPGSFALAWWSWRPGACARALECRAGPAGGPGGWGDGAWMVLSPGGGRGRGRRPGEPQAPDLLSSASTTTY